MRISVVRAARATDTRATGARRVLLASLVAAALFLLAACGAASAVGQTGQYEGIEVAEPTTLPHLVLTDTNGDPFNLATDTAGDVALLYFGFTHCPIICSTQLTTVSEALARPGAPKNVKLLFVTVDPERDTPEAIRIFLDKFSPDFIGLTADDDVQLTVLQNEVGALAALRLNKPADEVITPPHTHTGDANHSHDDAGHGDFQPGTGNYEVGHDARMFAFAPDGLGYTQYPNGTRISYYTNDLPLLAKITASASATPSAAPSVSAAS